MNYIGTVIKEIRTRKGISRLELSRGICSEKFVYLIEKGERNPSVEIIRMFNLRLGTDLFGYYDFLDCDDPVEVYDAMQKIYYYREIPDFETAKQISDKVKKKLDFKKIPWKYEVMLNDITYSAYVKNDCRRAVRDASRLLNLIAEKYKSENFVISLYVVLSSCYIKLEEFEKGEEALKKAEKIIADKGELHFREFTLISTRLNRISMCHHYKDYDEAINLGLLVVERNRKRKSYDRANLIYFNLAYSYYKKKMIDEAMIWFEKCLLDLSLYQSDPVMFYLLANEHFYEMLNNTKIKDSLRERIKKNYQL